MAQKLDDFIAGLRANTEAFEKAYLKKAEEHPEQYLLEMPDGNEGLWFEFFIGYVEDGVV
jgi:hypothetical protein